MLLTVSKRLEFSASRRLHVKDWNEQKNLVVFGPETLVGLSGEVREGGLVFVAGELWRAHTRDGAPLRAGEHVQVDALRGLELTVSQTPTHA